MWLLVRNIKELFQTKISKFPSIRYQLILHCSTRHKIHHTEISYLLTRDPSTVRFVPSDSMNITSIFGPGPIRGFKIIARPSPVWSKIWSTELGLEILHGPGPVRSWTDWFSFVDHGSSDWVLGRPVWLVDPWYWLNYSI